MFGTWMTYPTWAIFVTLTDDLCQRSFFPSWPGLILGSNPRTAMTLRGSDERERYRRLI